MDPASLALSIFGTLDICLKYGKRLVELCRETRNLQNDIAQITLTIEGVWLKTEIRLDLLKRLSRAGSLDHTLSGHYGEALQRLRVKISSLEAVHKRSISTSRFPQVAWTVYLKRHLEGVNGDLEEWQRRFDQSWTLFSSSSSSVFDPQKLSLIYSAIWNGKETSTATPCGRGFGPTKRLPCSMTFTVLGFCLLEMALWELFVRDDNGMTTHWLDLAIQVPSRLRMLDVEALRMKKVLIAITEDRLLAMVGDQYANIVLACLCC
ncbi:hypothetical protein BDQ94DRAFT_167760 [Aspergillus welwitschiae]|uniref:Fungal N-terminal domain-containing protein n=1 Tax=Aspergillus welwitschiae TaxID=1341132 RepID=A0A3F3QA96_9EURO|nr:hypothetical protein BDQ94DRAFT_167760 [Aspergillus welwitschiae]RDH36134.1 hypothetical protein BDQ94DRAFT_167760 [Aspergillus welwitschiae]